VTERLVCGADGHTGALITEAATERDLDVTAAGLDRARVESVVGRLGCTVRVFGLDGVRREVDQ
jgi:short subunit dehydrogenase-like uncharacterized protein